MNPMVFVTTLPDGHQHRLWLHVEFQGAAAPSALQPLKSIASYATGEGQLPATALAGGPGRSYVPRLSLRLRARNGRRSSSAAFWALSWAGPKNLLRRWVLGSMPIMFPFSFLIKAIGKFAFCSRPWNGTRRGDQCQLGNEKRLNMRSPLFLPADS